MNLSDAQSTNAMPTSIPINACLCMYMYKNLRKLRETKSACQHSMSACVSTRQHTSAYVSIRQHVSACVSISAYVSMRQHTSAYVSMCQHTSAYVSIRQHASAYVCVSITVCCPGSTLCLRIFVASVRVCVGRRATFKTGNESERLVCSKLAVIGAALGSLTHVREIHRSTSRG